MFSGNGNYKTMLNVWWSSELLVKDGIPYKTSEMIDPKALEIWPILSFTDTISSVLILVNLGDFNFSFTNTSSK